MGKNYVIIPTCAFSEWRGIKQTETSLSLLAFFSTVQLEAQRQPVFWTRNFQQCDLRDSEFCYVKLHNHCELKRITEEMQHKKISSNQFEIYLLKYFTDESMFTCESGAVTGLQALQSKNCHYPYVQCPVHFYYCRISE